MTAQKESRQARGNWQKPVRKSDDTGVGSKHLDIFMVLGKGERSIWREFSRFLVFPGTLANTRQSADDETTSFVFQFRGGGPHCAEVNLFTKQKYVTLASGLAGLQSSVPSTPASK